MQPSEVIELSSDEEDNDQQMSAPPWEGPDPDFYDLEASEDELPSADKLTATRSFSARRSSPPIPSSSQMSSSQPSTSAQESRHSSSAKSGRPFARTSSASSLINAFDNLHPTTGSQTNSSSNASSKKRKRTGGVDAEERARAKRAKEQEKEAADANKKALQALKAKQSLEKLSKTQRKKEQKELDKAEKEAQKAAKQAEKEKAQLSKQVNKLVSSKDQTLPDLTIEIGSALAGAPAFPTAGLKKYVASKAKQPVVPDVWPVALFDSPTFPNLIRWRRKMNSRYNEITQEWEAVDEYYKLENTQMLFVTFEALVAGKKSGDLTRRVQNLRNELGPKTQIHLMIASAGGRKKDSVEMYLSEIQLEYELFIARVHNDDIVDVICSMTGDLGVKPHKLIERSHLPICPDGTKTGTTPTDTYYKMLAKVHRLTDSAALAIMKIYPSYRALMKAYAIHQPAEAALLLKDVQISHTKSGQERKNQNLGPVLSRRVYITLNTPDSLTLVGPD